MIIPGAVAAVKTALYLQALRALMAAHEPPLEAYIVPSQDAHYTEYIATCHQRRPFISGFHGSAGTAVVTSQFALVWTDGRYFLQAEQELDENWELMRDGLPGTPSITEWLVQNLTAGQNVGIDATLYTKPQWDALETTLKANGKDLQPSAGNLVDQVWEQYDQPPCEANEIEHLPIEFSGQETKDKLTMVRAEMAKVGAKVLVVAELHEIAWLLNLRGSDLPTSSTFLAYVVVTDTNVHFFVRTSQWEMSTGAQEAIAEQVPDIVFHEYEDILTDLKNIIDNTDGKVWYNQFASAALVNLSPPDRVHTALTPISIPKSTKNEVEVAGFKNALIRDAAAIAEFFAWLEPTMAAGIENVTEISASNKLKEFRSKREYYKGDSFVAISASGPNGAVIHYKPQDHTDRSLSPDELYLLDSGGLYLDGTTDITRTVSFGQPTEYEKECYTRVLKGQLAVVMAVWPTNTVGHRLDTLARQALWEVGLEYLHGTGHGIGAYLNVHEGPQNIGNRHSAIDPGLKANMVTSNEPGYYEPDAFGIRLENDIVVVPVELEHNFSNLGFFGFEEMTFVPYQHKMINLDLLTDKEIEYLNNYQLQIREKIGKYFDDHMHEDGLSQAGKDWIWKETVPFVRNPGSDDRNGVSPTALVSPILALLSVVIASTSY